ncbi:hypothetical protein BCR23_01235 [Enterococcus quebecensis]|uniref:Uncharacterized protein n=1 Tax=Enterococcus quebecensis TaxID=903983 RepID=A0A1E5H379_9ENTE|nr:hypothetical protein BCR23_01235 [Enterococcus quebecensis]
MLGLILLTLTLLMLVECVLIYFNKNSNNKKIRKIALILIWINGLSIICFLLPVITFVILNK